MTRPAPLVLPSHCRAATRPECVTNGKTHNPFRARRTEPVNVNAHAQRTYLVDEAVDGADVPDLREVRGRRHARLDLHDYDVEHRSHHDDPPSTTTQRADTFATRIVGKLGNTVVFIRPSPPPSAIRQRRRRWRRREAAVAAAGGPGTNSADPRPTANDTTWPEPPAPACSRSTTRISTLSTSTTFGPATILIGEDTDLRGGDCDDAGTARPECVTNGQSQPFFVIAGTTNVDADTLRSILSPRR